MSAASRFWVTATVALTGMVVMAVEFAGARMLEAVWGSTLTVWGSTISVVLVGMAVGYRSGGLLADRRPQLSTLVWLLVLSAVSLLAVAVAGRPMILWVESLVSDPRGGSLAAAAVTLAAPALLLAAASPTAVRLTVGSAERAGRAAGSVYTAGTVGSVIGALGSAFWFVELLGLRALVAGSATLLMAWAAVGLLLTGRRSAGLLMLLAGVPVTAAAAAVVHAAGHGSDFDGRGVIVDRVQTGELDVTVVDEAGQRRLRFNDGLVQSAQDPRRPGRLLLPYSHAVHRAACTPARVDDVLLIGVGGGALVRSLHRLAPAAHIDAVEVHEPVLTLARRWFSLPDGDWVTFHVDDGRRFLQRTSRRYDLIVVDAFSAHTVPAHLLSREFFIQARRKLAADGTLTLNVVAEPESELAEAVAGTIASVFGDVEVRAPAGKTANLLFTSPARRPAAGCVAAAARRLGLSERQVAGWPVRVSPGRVLTDDRNPAGTLSRVK